MYRKPVVAERVYKRACPDLFEVLEVRESTRLAVIALVNPRNGELMSYREQVPWAALDLAVPG